MNALLADDDARARATAFRDVCRAWNGPARAADYLVATFLADGATTQGFADEARRQHVPES